MKIHRADYYRLLQEVREHGAWKAWLEFFLAGVADTANQAVEAATRIVELFRQDRERITGKSKRTGSALRIHDLLQQNPYLTANVIVDRTGFSAPTVNAALADLERVGIVEEDQTAALPGLRLSPLSRDPKRGHRSSSYDQVVHTRHVLGVHGAALSSARLGARSDGKLEKTP